MMSPSLSLSPLSSLFLIVLSFVLVAFGQPAWWPELGIISSCAGFALFWRVIIAVPLAKKRFFYSFIWFALVQCLQFSWFLTHPYSYIYIVYLFFSCMIGLQFGLISIFIQPQRIRRGIDCLGIAGLFTLFEWSRLFFLSGFSLNPIGLSLTSTILGLQSASLVGLYGLTFYVVLTNLLLLRVLVERKPMLAASWGCVAILPYIFGYFHLAYHDKQLKDPHRESLNVLLVQTAFPTEENLVFDSFQQAALHVQAKWGEIFKVLQPYQGQRVELIALPEYVVPYGTYLAIFPFDQFKKQWIHYFGDKGLPSLEAPLAMEVELNSKKQWQVTNAYCCQALANLFQTDLVVGLQDEEWVDKNTPESYSAAFYFRPSGELALRYEKRVLLPMGEYIPFEFCREMAKSYGITGSFTSGKEAKVFAGSKVPFGLTICYEETFGDLMRENRLKGADLLINLTSDVWYPNSRLPKQHFDHARLRSIENGIPLIRACNTGITSALDCVGRIIESLDEKSEWDRSVLFAQVPLYNYRTLYTYTGDRGIILASWFFTIILLRPLRKSLER